MSNENAAYRAIRANKRAAFGAEDITILIGNGETRAPDFAQLGRHLPTSSGSGHREHVVLCQRSIGAAAQHNQRQQTQRQPVAAQAAD